MHFNAKQLNMLSEGALMHENPCCCCAVKMIYTGFDAINNTFGQTKDRVGQLLCSHLQPQLEV